MLLVHFSQHPNASDQSAESCSDRRHGTIANEWTRSAKAPNPVAADVVG